MHAMHVNFIYRYTLTYYNTLKNLSSVDGEAILVDEAQNTPPCICEAKMVAGKVETT